MKAHIFFHFTLFAVALVVVFFTGAINAARADALKQKEIKRLLKSSVVELTYEYTGT